MALEQARRSDTVYRGDISAVEDDPDGEQTLRIERRLKDRVRVQLGLPPLKDVKELSLAAYAKLHGFDPSFDLPPEKRNVRLKISGKAIYNCFCFQSRWNGAFPAFRTRREQQSKKRA